MTTMTKKFFGALLTLAMVLTIAPTTIARAAGEPYAAIIVQGNEGNLYYYQQSGGSFVAVFSRCLWWSHDTHELRFSSSNELLTKNLLEKSEPAYAEAGKYVVWQEPNNVLRVKEYGSKEDAKKFENVSFYKVDSENFLTKVFLTDGTEKNFSDFLAAPATTATPTTAPTATPVATASASPSATPVVSATPAVTASVTPSATPVATSSAAPSATATVAPTVTPSATPVATASPAATTTPVVTASPTVATAVPTVTPSVSGLSVDVSIDSAGQTVYKVSDGHKVVVSGNDVYWDAYKISELCASSVRFVGIDGDGKVYLYEDATASYYRFNPANIFSPEKIKLPEGATLVKAVNNDRNVMVELQTSIGSFKVEQLATDTTWYPGQTYCINKADYCQYYLADTNESHILTLKGGILYLGVKQIQTGITRNTESFGFAGSKIYCLKGSKAYWATISAPTNWHLWKQNVAKLTYSEKDGTVSGVKKLSTKQDYVKNSKTLKSATLYQSGIKAKGVKITSKGTKVSLDGKVIAKLSKKQKKAKVKYTSVGFTEDGYLYVRTNKRSYRALLSAPQALKKWNISKVTYDSLGFCSKG